MASACKPERRACAAGFHRQHESSLASCSTLTGRARRACRRTARRDFAQNKRKCRAAMRQCERCCDDPQSSRCTATVCGDGSVAGAEECEPPGTQTCDTACRAIAPPTSTTVSPTTSTTTTTTLLPPTGTGVTVELSSPPNGTHFVPGDQPVVIVVLNDDDGNPLTRSDFSTLNLYMYGPQEEPQTTTAAALLRASTDRNARPHHYIDLKTNADAVADENVVTYSLSAVTSELPGTYSVTVWAVRSGDTLEQWMPLADCQIGTATVETQIVEKTKCAACHLGPGSGQFYMHHVDPGYSPTGSPSLDSWPVRTCKACHNRDGYAGYDNGAGGTDANVNRSSDPIVRRVHGVHRGEELSLPFNTDPTTGDFKDYTSVVFPDDLKNCTKCHADDRWRTEPSRMACTSCHDDTWFGNPNATPAGYTNHPGDQWNDDTTCFLCHGAGKLYDTAAYHQATPPALNAVDLSLTPPANGQYYVEGEAPLVTIVLRDDNGNPIDHTKVTAVNFNTAGLFVYGDRSRSVPVLTNTARYGTLKLRASASNTTAASGSPAGWTFAPGDTFRIAVNDGAYADIAAPVGFQTPAQVRDWLIANLSDVTVTSTSTAVTIKSNLQGASSKIAIYDSPVTTIMGWKSAGTTVDPDIRVGTSSYPINDLRALSDPLDYADPAVTRTAANITYQLDDVAGLAPGTYAAYVWSRPNTGKVANLSRIGWAYLPFQVGTATVQKKVASNCADCHGSNIMHAPSPTERGPHPAPFDADVCKACHDYSHFNTGEDFKNQGGTSLNGWSGFGAAPISRRVHGLHRGRYLEHPEQIYSGGNPFAELVFPMDIRNCTKCHSETDAWTENPGRVACLGCHDTDAAKTHARLNTYIGDAADPYGPSAVESCDVCHGGDRPWSAAIVHKINDPYVPPYPREP